MIDVSVSVQRQFWRAIGEALCHADQPRPETIYDGLAWLAIDGANKQAVIDVYASHAEAYDDPLTVDIIDRIVAGKMVYK